MVLQTGKLGEQVNCRLYPYMLSASFQTAAHVTEKNSTLRATGYLPFSAFTSLQMDHCDWQRKQSTDNCCLLQAQKHASGHTSPRCDWEYEDVCPWCSAKDRCTMQDVISPYRFTMTLNRIKWLLKLCKPSQHWWLVLYSVWLSKPH